MDSCMKLPVLLAGCTTVPGTGWAAAWSCLYWNAVLQYLEQDGQLHEAACTAGMLYYSTWNKMSSCMKLPVLLECCTTVPGTGWAAAWICLYWWKAVLQYLEQDGQLHEAACTDGKLYYSTWNRKDSCMKLPVLLECCITVPGTRWVVIYRQKQPRNSHKRALGGRPIK